MAHSTFDSHKYRKHTYHTSYMDPSSPSIKSSRLRRRRGYMWEDSLAKRLNNTDSWRAFRLGSPSTGLPDVLAVNTSNSEILVMEAKSGAKTSLSVPPNQIRRCLDWCDVLEQYEIRTVVLAFKFIAKKRLSSGVYKSRPMREYYKIWDPAMRPVEVVCTYDGETYILEDGHRQEMAMADYAVPFD